MVNEIKGIEQFNNENLYKVKALGPNYLLMPKQKIHPTLNYEINLRFRLIIKCST